MSVNGQSKSRKNGELFSDPFISFPIQAITGLGNPSMDHTDHCVQKSLMVLFQIIVFNPFFRSIYIFGLHKILCYVKVQEQGFVVSFSFWQGQNICVAHLSQHIVFSVVWEAATGSKL